MFDATAIVKGRYMPRKHGGLELAHQNIDQALQPVKGKGEILCFGVEGILEADQVHRHYDSFPPIFNATDYDCQVTLTPGPKHRTPYWTYEDWRQFASYTLLGVDPWSHGWLCYLAIVRPLPRRPQVQVFFSSKSRLYRKDHKGMRENANQVCEWNYGPWRELDEERERNKIKGPLTPMQKQMNRRLKEIASRQF